ncbi:hypothetical protein B484DRAFT_409474 [Ochromonadaceae sp. CCMP2298]|nr:hypothetical protein B484DRAFT_409474 [Ochromonadaceae sp. CCMP2298]
MSNSDFRFGKGNPTKEEEAEALQKLPAFHLMLKDNDGEVFLTCFVRNVVEAGEKIPIAITLLDMGILKQGTSDDEFVCGVTLFDEQNSKKDWAIVDVHREALKMMCGEESIALLESHMRLGTLAYIYTGGRAPSQSPSTPQLHRVYPLRTPEQKRADMLARLPLFELKNVGKEGDYLTLTSRHGSPAGAVLPNAVALADLGLVQRESADDKFVCGVTVYHAQGGYDEAVVDVHREALKLMCGEEAVTALEAHRRICRVTWYMMGGDPDYSEAPTDACSRLVRLLGGGSAHVR